MSRKSPKKKTAEKASKRSPAALNKDESQHVVGAMVEYFDSKFDLIIEGQQGIARQTEKVEESLHEHTKESQFQFQVMGEVLGGMRVDAKKNFEQVTQYLLQLDDEVQDIKRAWR